MKISSLSSTLSPSHLSPLNSCSYSLATTTAKSSDDQTSTILDVSALNSSSVMGIIHLVDMTTTSSTSKPPTSENIDDYISSSDNNSSKVIQIYLPAKQLSNQTFSSSNQTNKRPRFDQTPGNSSTDQTLGTFTSNFSSPITHASFLLIISLSN